jgi:cation transport ATPase
MNGELVTIVKDGELTNVFGDSLLKDDLVVIQAGDIVPADLKLIEARALEVDEFELTGEIMPVVKRLGEDDVIIHMGSKVLKGTGKGFVVAAGEQTEYGKILRQEWELEQPYEVRIFKKRYLVLAGLILPAFLIQIAQSNQDAVVIASYLLLSVVLILLQNDELFEYVGHPRVGRGWRNTTSSCALKKN